MIRKKELTSQNIEEDTSAAGLRDLKRVVLVLATIAQSIWLSHHSRNVAPRQRRLRSDYPSLQEERMKELCRGQRRRCQG